MAVDEASRATMAAVGTSFVRTFHLDFDEPVAGLGALVAGRP